MAEENADQKLFWETFAEKWVANQADLDGLMQPVLDEVLRLANLKSGQRVLDIGCGTGTSTLMAAQAVGPDGHVTGADIAEPMLKQARLAAKGRSDIAFTTADVADFAFAHAAFNVVMSRFGVMFFADPIAAFKNIARAMKPGATLHMGCWAGLEDNPWFAVPLRAAMGRLGAPPPLDPFAPGPLAFRDIDRVCGILKAAGLSEVSGVQRSVALTPPGALLHVAQHATQIGPAARTIAFYEATAADVQAITNAVASGFESFQHSDGLRVPAAINFFSAMA